MHLELFVNIIAFSKRLVKVFNHKVNMLHWTLEDYGILRSTMYMYLFSVEQSKFPNYINHIWMCDRKMLQGV